MFDVHDFVHGELADGQRSNESGNTAEQVKIRDGFAVEGILEEVAEESEDRGHGVEKDEPGEPLALGLIFTGERRDQKHTRNY